MSLHHSTSHSLHIIGYYWEQGREGTNKWPNDIVPCISLDMDSPILISLSTTGTAVAKCLRLYLAEARQLQEAPWDETFISQVRAQGGQWASSPLCWIFCWHRGEGLHIGLHGPTWRLDSGGEGCFQSPTPPPRNAIPPCPEGVQHLQRLNL